MVGVIFPGGRQLDRGGGPDDPGAVRDRGFRHAGPGLNARLCIVVQVFRGAVTPTRGDAR